MVVAGRILVVDDEPVVNEGCRRVLAQEGHAVQTTESGREGLTRAVAEDFDLVITDLKMPDLDGMELVRTLRSDRPNTAIVIITGYGTVTSAVEAIQLGVSDYIEKPFTPDDLTEAVDRALRVGKGEPRVRIQAGLVKGVLMGAARAPGLGGRPLPEGSRVLSGLALSTEAKAAIASGDIAWIEKPFGELSPEERDWLERRLDVGRGKRNKREESP